MATRILHVVGKMNRGGVETWLMNVLRHIDRTKFQIDFLVHTEQHCAYDDEIRALGSRIIPCMHPSQPLKYARNFRRVLRECGTYDVVHSHVHHFSGYVLWLAYQQGVPIRIAHSHSDTSHLQTHTNIARSIYLSVMEHLIQRYATNGIAASSEAGKSLFVQGWGKDSRWKVLYCGINLLEFRAVVNKSETRSGLGIPENAFVIGHVGSFIPVKNHNFIIEIAKEVIKTDSNVYFLLVGDGYLRPQIETSVLDSGLIERVIFAGLRSDVPQLMLGTMDIFLMPSLYEGLPVAALEAQAAGLRCVLSDTISPEVSVVKGVVRWLSLSQPAKVWAEMILALRNKSSPLLPFESTDWMEKSAMNIQVSIRELISLYGD